MRLAVEWFVLWLLQLGLGLIWMSSTCRGLVGHSGRHGDAGQYPSYQRCVVDPKRSPSGRYHHINYATHHILYHDATYLTLLTVSLHFPLVFLPISLRPWIWGLGVMIHLDEHTQALGGVITRLHIYLAAGGQEEAHV